MAFEWIRETHPSWDADKQHIIGDAPAGIFDRRYAALAAGAPLLGEWWRVTSDGRTLGYGWLDAAWGDAEILLATAPAARRQCDRAVCWHQVVAMPTRIKCGQPQ